MFKKVAIYLLAVAFISGCGYKMVLTGTKAAFTLYPDRIENRTSEIEATSAFEDGVNIYLATINALAEKDKADYQSEFILTSLKYSGSSSTSTTTTANVFISMNVVVRDKDNKVVFNRTFSTYENYSNTPSMSETTNNRNDALEDAIARLMTDFRNGFERK